MSFPNNVGGPSREEALQLATMLAAGAPAQEAIRYFLPEDATEVMSTGQVADFLARWMRSKEVERAIVSIQGKDWRDMTAGEKIQFAINKHYTEMAYYLYSRNYVDLSGQEKAKADTCRVALEAKIAGTAGKMTAV